MVDEKLLDNFIALFRGRGDVYGMDSGGCAKLPLNRGTFERHLTGSERIGVYPIVPVNSKTHLVVWGCSDFDLGVEKSIHQARQLHDALKAGGVTSWIEQSRSKGYHVWVFATEPVPAETMRNMLLAAHQVAEVPATEVNPKQTSLAPNQYGNYVRLPYPNYTDETTRSQRVLNPNSQSVLHICDFISMAIATRNTPDDIARLAAHYKPIITKPALPAHTEYDATLDEAMRVLSPLGKVIWRDGPLPNKDRSSTLAKLGYECVKTGLNPSQTKIIIKTADKRWGKYHLRTNGDIEIDKLVIRVHS